MQWSAKAPAPLVYSAIRPFPPAARSAHHRKGQLANPQQNEDDRGGNRQQVHQFAFKRLPCGRVFSGRYWLRGSRLSTHFCPAGGTQFYPIRNPCSAIFAKHGSQLNFAPQPAQNAAPAESFVPQLRQNFGAGGATAVFACLASADFSAPFGAEAIAAA